MTRANDLETVEGSEFVDSKAIARLASALIEQQQANGHQIPKGKKTAAIEYARRKLLDEVIRQVMEARQLTLTMAVVGHEVTFQHFVELVKDANPGWSHDQAVEASQSVLTVVAEIGKPAGAEVPSGG